MFDSNRRKYPRANFPCHLTMWLADGSNETVMAITANIGVGGICVHLNHGYGVGTKVDIQIHFTNSTTPFKCSGMLVRLHKENEKYYNVGIQFDPLNELKYSFLDGKVSELIDLEQKGKS